MRRPGLALRAQPNLDLGVLGRMGDKTIMLGVIDCGTEEVESVETVATILKPRRLRVAALLRQIEITGVNALPIVGLLSFLIGVVVAYQGADQLRQFGVEVLNA